jgi:4-amino-4-deoxy-L-arabinose transferase-like glycosyltransferase
MKDEGGRISSVVARSMPIMLMRIAQWLILHPSPFILPLFVLWSAAHLDGYSWDYDEGIHVYIAWLVQQGHPLYTQTFSPYTPGFIVALVAAFSLFGATMFVARMLAVLCAALGVLGVMWAAGELAGGEKASAPAEYAAALLLFVTPAFLQWSRAAMSDLPAAALAALAVGLALVYLRVRRLRWLVAAEFMLACALWIKLISIGAVAAVGVVVLLRLREQPGEVRRVLAASAIVGVLALLPLMFFDVRGLYEQALYFHVQKRAAYDQTLLDRIQILADFVATNGILSALALLGALSPLGPFSWTVAARKTWSVIMIWLGATAASLLAQSPLFANHHPVVLALPLAALGGAGIAFGLRSLWAAWGMVRGVQRASGGRIWISAGATLVCVGLAIAGSSQYDAQLRAAISPPFQPVAEEAEIALAALTAPDELVVSDAQMIAFRARRQSPPSLADTSSARLVSGNLTDEQLIAQTQSSGANTILFWSGRLESAGAFVQWVGQNYRVLRSVFQKPNAPYQFWMRRPQPEHPLEAQFGEGITLLGYDLNRRSEVAPTTAHPLALTLYFQRSAVIGRSYTIFMHLLAPDGRVAAQSDRPALDGRYPTDQWQSNEWIVDELTLAPESELAGGNYSVELGFYAPDTLQRLPVRVAGVLQPDDRLLLGPFTLRSTVSP